MRSLANFLSPKASKTPVTKPYNPNFQSAPPSRKDENYNIDVLCTNCQEMINVNEIDKHSMTCCQVSEKVFQIENNLSVDQIEYKLSKLKEALENHISQRRGFDDSRNEENHAREIIGYINQILYFERRSDLKKIKTLKDLLSIIQEKLDNFRGSTSLLLYLERVKLLGKEKYRELIKQDQESITSWKEQINFGNQPGSNNFTQSTNSSLNTAPSSHFSTGNLNTKHSVNQGLKSPTGFGVQTNAYASNPFYQRPEEQGSVSSPSFPMQRLSQANSAYPNPNFGQTASNYEQNYPYRNESNSYMNRNVSGSRLSEPYPTETSKSRVYTDNQRESLQPNRYTSNNPYTGRNLYSPSTPFQPFDISKKHNQMQNTQYNTQYEDNSSPNNNQSASRTDLHSASRGNNPFDNSSSQRLLTQSPQGYDRDYQNGSYSDYDSQPRPSQGIIRQQLENKLQNTKKEYTQITQLVDNYKKKTEAIQSSINSSYGSAHPRQLSSHSGTRDSPTHDFNQRQSPMSQDSYDRNYQTQERKYNQTDNQLIKLRQNMIEDIESDYERRGLSSKYSETQETSSNIDRSKGHRQPEDFGFEDIDQNYELQAMQDASQEEQRLFYSKCLAIKLKFRTQDLAQLVPVALVYKDAVQRNIPERDWDAFIENAFRHPEQYIDLKKIQKKKKHGLRNNLAEIAKTKVIPKRNRDNFQNIDIIYE